MHQAGGQISHINLISHVSHIDFCSHGSSQASSPWLPPLLHTAVPAAAHLPPVQTRLAHSLALRGAPARSQGCVPAVPLSAAHRTAAGRDPNQTCMQGHTMQSERSELTMPGRISLAQGLIVIVRFLMTCACTCALCKIQQGESAYGTSIHMILWSGNGESPCMTASFACRPVTTAVLHTI